MIVFVCIYLDENRRSVSTLESQLRTKNDKIQDLNREIESFESRNESLNAKIQKLEQQRLLFELQQKNPSNEDDNKEKQLWGGGRGAVKLLNAWEISIGDEKFHPKHKYKTLSIEEGGSVLKATENKAIMCGFGSIECSEKGKTYHWKIQILEGSDVNLGVIFSEMVKKNTKQMWWLSEEGYSYWSDDGQIYHSDKYKKYGDKYGKGDTIDVWLSLKKYYIAFAKNGEKYGKAFKVNREKGYRLGVGFSGAPHTVQLIKFDIA